MVKQITDFGSANFRKFLEAKSRPADWFEKEFKGDPKMDRTKFSAEANMLLVPNFVEFKQFQRLPDWPVIVKLSDRDHSSNNGSEQKTALPDCAQDGASTSQSFAE